MVWIDAEPADLAPELKNRLSRYSDMRVLVRADRSVQFSYMRDVLRAIGESGVDNVTFSAVDKDMSEAAPVEQIQ